MSATAFIAICATACLVWVLMAWQSKHEQRHADAVGSSCDECFKWCAQGERLCITCKRRKRAAEIKGER